MNVAIAEMGKPTEAKLVEGKLNSKRVGADARFERVLDEVEPRKEVGTNDQRPEGGAKSVRKSIKKAGAKLTGEDRLAALVDAVASSLNKALGEMTKGRVKPEDKQHVEQAITQRRNSQKPIASLFARVNSKVTEDGGEEGSKAKGGQKQEQSELPDTQRIMSSREPAPILTTRSTPFEVRLAATVQSARPTAAVAPTNQHMQIRPTNEGGAAQIRLDLGNGTHLDVAIDVRDGVARVQLRSNGADVANRMSMAADDLIKALQDSGIDAAEVDIQWDEPESQDHERPEHADDDDDEVEESDGHKFTSFVHIVT